MIKITLQKVLNQRITQASGDRTRHNQAQSRLVRYSQRHYCSRFSAGRLHRKSRIHAGSENVISETSHASSSSEDSS